MNIHPYAKEIFEEVKSWRHHIHTNPELSLDEYDTSLFIKSKLDKMGITYTEMAGTGVVATIKKGAGNRAIGMRCELDALALQEINTFEHKSQSAGKMHACGHDGHTAMLLGACKALNEVGEFDGTVHLIFQPGEEGAGGAKIMLDDGLLEKCHMEEIYAIHNWPGIAVGKAGVVSGPVMAATDTFFIKLTGSGGHAAMPSLASDPIVAGVSLITALQTLVSRNVDPVDKAVLSVTIVNAGSADNIIPDDISIEGTVRTFLPATRDLLESRIEKMVEGFSIAYAVKGDCKYNRGYPATINDVGATDNAISVINELLGEENVDTTIQPCMGGEDFSYILEKISGNYLWLGNGDSKPLHNTGFDFNDNLIPIGISYWLEMAKERLPENE